MNAELMLTLLKVDLGITTDRYDERLEVYIEAARTAIETEGVSLDSDSPSDGNLVVMYAAWLWRKRDTGEGMPRSLRWMLNNRLMSEKVAQNG